MGDDPEARRRIANRLTTLKLALQSLERKTELSQVQRRLVRAAAEALDGLIDELLGEWRAGRISAAAPAPLRRTERAGRRDGWAVLRRVSVPGHAAAAVLLAAALLVLIVVGALLVLHLLWPVLLVGVVTFAVVTWLIRR